MADNEQPQPNADQKVEDASGFSEAFAERSKGPSEERREDAAADAGSASADNGGSSASADAPGAAEQSAADEGSGTKAPAFDPYAGLTPEQKSHFEKLASSERSNRGRVGALTKKLNSFGGTRQPPAGEASSQARDDGGTSAGTGATGAAEASDIEARLKAATDEYGDIVGPLAEVVTDLRQKITDLTASATRHEVDRDAEALTEAYGALETAHPDYQQVAADPKFHAWLSAQPAGVIALANSFDPKEVSLTLQLFKSESAAASQASGEVGEGSSGSSATGDRRERQLDGMRQPPQRGAPAASGKPNDFSSGFAERARRANG